MAIRDQWTELWAFETARFRVTLDVTWEDFPDLSWDEDGEVTRRVESGEFGVYCFRVVVYLDGREVAADHLGNCIYADPEEFRKEHLGAGRNRGGYFPDMVRVAASEARKALHDVPRLRAA